MQQWLNEPKNQPIVFGLAAVLLVGAIVLILFTSGVIGGRTPYVPPAASGPAVATGPTMPGAPAPGSAGGNPTPPLGGDMPTGPTGPGAMPQGPGMAPTKVGGMPGRSMAKTAGSKHIMPGRPGVITGRPGDMSARLPGSAGAAPGMPQVGTATAAVATTAVSSGLPDARKDPFALKIDLSQYIRMLKKALLAKPRVDALVPPLTITTYSPPSTTAVASNMTGPTAYGNQMEQTAPIGRVSGVMIGNGTGAYAIVDNNGQSQVLQPGDELPGNAGKLISIQSDSISVSVNGQIVKVPISTGDNSQTGQGGYGAGGYAGFRPPAYGQRGGYNPTNSPNGYNSNGNNSSPSQ